MSIRSKAVSVAALGMFLVAGSMIGGVSMADDTVPAATVDRPAATPSSNSPPSDAQRAPATAFAVFKEVVQPLPSSYQQQDPADDDGAGKVYTSLAAMVDDTDVDTPLDPEARCLATAVFFEARSESLEGQLAVAHVVINRAHSSRFADSFCAVIRQRHQFSFVRRGVIPEPDTTRPSWKTAIAIARIAMEDGWANKAKGALFFHARRVSPRWGRQRIATIDHHIFYR